MSQIKVLRNKEALKNLKKGLEEHYHLLIELIPRDHKLTFLDSEVDSIIKNSSAVSL
jgi:short-subunit dehydrogenase